MSRQDKLEKVLQASEQLNSRLRYLWKKEKQSQEWLKIFSDRLGIAIKELDK